MSVITENCQILGVLEKATELMSPAEIGEPIGMTALDAGRRLYWMQGRLVEKPDKEKALYRITQKGKDYLANPPKEPQGSVGKVVEKVDGKVDGKVDEKSEAEKKEEGVLSPLKPTFSSP